MFSFGSTQKGMASFWCEKVVKYMDVQAVFFILVLSMESTSPSCGKVCVTVC